MGDIDYAMLQEVYGTDLTAEKRYSPAKIIGMTTEVDLIRLCGDPHSRIRSSSSDAPSRLRWKPA